MADFRRWFYALALVALLAGFTGQVRAQSPTFVCTSNVAVPPVVRVEGFTELVGDITLNCTGGISTPAGQAVPPVNITIALNTDVTSRLLAANLYDEALLIMDEPHSAIQPARPILNCGAAGAPDTGASGPGVCSIISNGNSAQTYDGTPNISNTTTCGAASTTNANYGCGRPNVFQGRTGTPQNPNQYNAVTFLGVPLDPPGSINTRTIRITNIRANAQYLGVSTTFNVNTILAQIAFNGNTSLAISNNPQGQVVAYIEHGLLAGGVFGDFSFLQCVSQNPGDVAGSASHAPVQTSPLNVPTYTFTEGFASSWKTKNISFVTNQAGNGTLQPGNSYWSYATTHPTLYPADQNQNVPGAIYNTESGFEYPSVTAVADPSPNPPNGVGTYQVSASTNGGLSDATTGISGAGIANQGTRLALQLSSPVAGSTVLAPTEVYLYNTTTCPIILATCIPTGVMVMTNTDASGNGSFTPSGTIGTSNLVAVQSSGLIVYEILFSDPFSLEFTQVPLEVAYVSNLAQNLPAPNATAQVAGGFAPFYAPSSGALNTASGASSTPPLPVPRFVQNFAPVNLYEVSKCACDILFPYVVSAAGYDTGIAIANTSLDPGAQFGFGANPQSGSVEFWYYGVGANNGAPPGTQCTNTASPGTCPGTTVVPFGQVLTYVASSGSSQWGLDSRAAGFVGYVIAQAQFQWCHAFAFIGALGAGPTSQQISEGYLGLILDLGGLNRTHQQSENLLH